jgi:DNA-binding IscR family transcriptional regulator
MLSSKIIAAVEIIQALEPILDKKEGTRNLKLRSLNSSLLSVMCTEPLHIILRALKNLTKYKWIGRNSGGYYLIIHPEDVSLYDLYKILHGGIPLGDVADGLNKNYRDIHQWIKMEKTEDRLMNILENELRQIKLSDMIINNLVILKK